MDRINDNTERQESNESRSVPFGSPAGILRFLYERLDSKALGSEDLTYLSQSSELACHMAMNLATTVSGIGCLVLGDDQPGKLQEGNFRTGDSFSELMFTLSNQIDIIGELANIGSEASFRLRERPSHE